MSLDLFRLLGRIDINRREAEDDLRRVDERAEGVGNTLRNAVLGGAVAAGAAILGIGAAAVSMASQTQQATQRLQAQLGISADEAERLGDVALRVFGNNFAGSVEEAADAVATVRQQIKGLSDEELQFATESAFGLADAFGTDLVSSTNAVNTLMNDFGLTSQEAFDFVTAGMQRGLNSSGDFLDSITEYGPQFRAGGADAGQFFSTLESGLQGGVLGTDKAADAFKEFRVRILDGSEATSDALGQLGIDAEQLTSDLADGTITTADAFQLVTDKISNTTDSAVQLQAGVGLLGTQFEDMGADAIAALDLSQTELAELEGATESLGVQYDTLGAAFTGLQRKLSTMLVPIGERLIPILEDLVNYIDTFMPQIEATLLGVFDALITVGEGAAFLFRRLIDLADAAGVASNAAQLIQRVLIAGGVVGAIYATTLAVQQLRAALVAVRTFMATAVIPTLVAWSGVILTVGAVVAAFYAAYRSNFMGIRDITDTAVARIGNAFKRWSDFMEAVGDNWDDVSQFFVTAQESIAQAANHGQQAFQFAWAYGVSAVKLVFSSLLTHVETAMETLINGVLNGINTMITQLNRVPGVMVELIPEVDLNAWESTTDGIATQMIGLRAGMTAQTNKIGDVLGELGNAYSGLRDTIVTSMADNQAASDAAAESTEQLGEEAENIVVPVTEAGVAVDDYNTAATTAGSDTGGVATLTEKTKDLSDKSVTYLERIQAIARAINSSEGYAASIDLLNTALDALKTREAYLLEAGDIPGLIAVQDEIDRLTQLLATLKTQYEETVGTIVTPEQVQANKLNAKAGQEEDYYSSGGGAAALQAELEAEEELARLRAEQAKHIDILAAGQAQAGAMRQAEIQQEQQIIAERQRRIDLLELDIEMRRRGMELSSDALQSELEARETQAALDAEIYDFSTDLARGQTRASAIRQDEIREEQRILEARQERLRVLELEMELRRRGAALEGSGSGLQSELNTRETRDAAWEQALFAGGEGDQTSESPDAGQTAPVPPPPKDNFFDKAVNAGKQLGDSLVNLAKDKIPLVGSVMEGFAQGGPIGAVVAVFTELLGSTDAFQNIIEAANKVLEPIISAISKLLDALWPLIDVFFALVEVGLAPIIWLLKNVVAPVFEFVAKLVASIWNAIARGINAVLGWLGVNIRTIDVNGNTSSESGSSNPSVKEPKPDDRGDTYSGGTSIGEITGPSRKLLETLLSPLANLDSLLGVNNRIYNLLDSRLGSELAGASVGTFGNVTFEPNSIVINGAGGSPEEISDTLLRKLDRALGDRSRFIVKGV